MQRQVEATEFRGQRALIIGGSRGLGEVTAKLLVAGGAEVKITYHKGEKDANQVVDEISSCGGRAACFSFNVLNCQENLTEKLGKQWIPNYLYYFATPFIFMGTKRVFSPQLFQKFCDYYVIGFINTIQTIRNLGIGLEKILYPSSVAINELPSDMGEYTAAKMAGEVLCDFLKKTNPKLTIHKPRLPRIATDQTTSLFAVNNHDPLPLLLAYLRSLRDA